MQNISIPVHQLEHDSWCAITIENVKNQNKFQFKWMNWIAFTFVIQAQAQCLQMRIYKFWGEFVIPFLLRFFLSLGLLKLKCKFHFSVDHFSSGWFLLLIEWFFSSARTARVEMFAWKIFLSAKFVNFWFNFNFMVWRFWFNMNNEWGIIENLI